MASVRTFLYSYLKGWILSVNINNVHHLFQIPLSVVPLGCILGQLHFSIVDLFCFIKDAQLLNLADDDIIATFSISVDDLITELQKESEKALYLFFSNEMEANPDKFKSVIINKLGKLKDSYELLIDNYKNNWLHKKWSFPWGVFQ